MATFEQVKSKIDKLIENGHKPQLVYGGVCIDHILITKCDGYFSLAIGNDEINMSQEELRKLYNEIRFSPFDLYGYLNS